MEILERWRKKGLNSRFVFDLLPEEFKFTDKENQTKCEHELKMKISSKNRTIQQSLNKIGREIGIEGFMSMHIARHTFAIVSKLLPIRACHTYTRKTAPLGDGADKKSQLKHSIEGCFCTFYDI